MYWQGNSFGCGPPDNRLRFAVVLVLIKVCWEFSSFSLSFFYPLTMETHVIEKFLSYTVLTLTKQKTKKKSEQLSFQARVWTLLSPTSNIPLVLDNSNHHGAFSFSSSSFGCCYVNGGEHNGNGWKTKVKKNKVRERSMRREHVAHFQWVACGDIDLFIHEKYDEASEPSHVLVREIGKLCLACMRVEPEKMQKEISRIISCW